MLGMSAFALFLSFSSSSLCFNSSLPPFTLKKSQAGQLSLLVAAKPLEAAGG